MYTYSVSKRAKTVAQPRGGFLPLSLFTRYSFEDGLALKEGENIPAGITGQAVDYMSRFVSGFVSPQESFNIALLGAIRAGKGQRGMELLGQIKGLDDSSLVSACKLASYDTFYRVPGSVFSSEPEPNSATLFNLRLMVTRMVSFLAEYGPITAEGFTMEGGYTDIVSSGDGDFLTENTLWDIKTSKKTPTSKDTLQLLMYYIMGKHSWNSDFDSIQNIGIMNPRLNSVWLLDANTISTSLIQQVSRDVIGY